MSIKPLLLLLLLALPAAVAVEDSLPLERPFYRKGETITLTLEKISDAGTALLVDARGLNHTLTWTPRNGKLTAIYTLGPDDPPGTWRLLLDGGGTEAHTFYVIDPLQTLLGAGVGAIISLLSATLRRLTTDIEKLRRVRAELLQFQKEMREALKSRDKGKLEKLKRREAYIKRLQADQMKDQLRFMGITFIPFLLVYYALIGLIGAGTVVAYSPIPIPVLFFTLGPPLTIITWYILSSFAFSIPITKLLGVGLD